MKPTILICHGDDLPYKNLKRRLSNQGFEIAEATDNINIIRFFQYNKPHLIIIISPLNNKTDTMEVINHIRKQDKKVPIILINKYSSEDGVIAALRAGVNDYYKQPFTFGELMDSINLNLSIYSHKPLSKPMTSVPDPDGVSPMISHSNSIQKIKTYILKAAAIDSNVLITGETGTGKELAAVLIHTNSLKCKYPFVYINCACIPDALLESELFGYEQGAFTGAEALKQGKFEIAEGGTIFLDEIGDMSLYSQAKILSAIERKEVYRLGGKRAIPLNVRIISATNRDPEQMVANGKFREDLYYRLNIARIHLPPLRDRKEDIIPLIDYYIQKFNNQFSLEVKGFTEEALTFLLRYDWPGNIRELKNLIEAAFINLPSQRISLMELPQIFQEKLKKSDRFPKTEREKLLSTLQATSWNKSKSAQMLNLPRMTLYRKMSKYHISAMSEDNNLS